MEDHLRQLLIEELHRARHGYGLASDFTGEGSEFSPSCGDAVTVRVGPGGFSWEGNGCAVSMAAASALGATTVDDFRMLVHPYLASVAPGGAPAAGELEPFAGIGRFPLRARCATLAWQAALTAVGEAEPPNQTRTTALAS